MRTLEITILLFSQGSAIFHSAISQAAPRSGTPVSERNACKRRLVHVRRPAVRHVLQFDYTCQIPGIPALPKFIGSGWQFNGITVMRSGDLVPGVPVTPANFDLPTRVLNIAAFEAPAAGKYDAAIFQSVGYAQLAGYLVGGFGSNRQAQFRLRNVRERVSKIVCVA